MFITHLCTWWTQHESRNKEVCCLSSEQHRTTLDHQSLTIEKLLLENTLFKMDLSMSKVLDQSQGVNIIHRMAITIWKAIGLREMHRVYKEVSSNM